MSVVFKVKLDRPCKLCTCCTDKAGYGQMKYEGKQERAHRVAYALAHNLSMDDIRGITIRHRCDTPGCIEPTHLEPGSVADNNHDMVKRGRQVRGERHGRARLTADQVRAIRQRLANGHSNKSVALDFGISSPTVSLIKTGRFWKHIS